MSAARWTSADLTALQSKRLDKKVKALPKAETAARITQNILRMVNMQPGCTAYRINNVGVWDEAKQIHRRGGTKKGISDISATIRGRACWIEVKAGKDVMSDDQIYFQDDQRRAGALCFVARSSDEFARWFTEILKQC